MLQVSIKTDTTLLKQQYVYNLQTICNIQTHTQNIYKFPKNHSLYKTYVCNI